MRPLLALFAGALLAGCAPDAPTPTAAPRSQPPRAVRTPPPDYPEVLACDGIGGRVDLRVTIEPGGQTGAIAMQRSSGHRELDEAAVAAVRGWTFAPATRLGKPVRFTISVPMTFNPPVERPDRCFVLDEQRD
jgi:protein TonB